MTSIPTTPTQHPELLNTLIELGMHGLADRLDDFLAEAVKRKHGALKVIQDLAELEQRERAIRGLERRKTRAKVGAFKPMADFDWNWPEVIDRALVERLLALSFHNEGANVVLVGAHGLGKTMILKNIAHNAVLAGQSVLFITAAKMLNDLSAQDSARGLERRIKHYVSKTALCIDELGYLSYDNRAADLLFEVVSRRHELRRPILLSTNLAFKQWTTVFPSATCTVALVDRLTHRADIVKLKGESWRRKESQERNKERRKPKA